MFGSGLGSCLVRLWFVSGSYSVVFGSYLGSCLGSCRGSCSSASYERLGSSRIRAWCVSGSCMVCVRFVFVFGFVAGFVIGSRLVRVWDVWVRVSFVFGSCLVRIDFVFRWYLVRIWFVFGSDLDIYLIRISCSIYICFFGFWIFS